MKVGLIVLCRYNSSRLPGKILKQINGKALLDYILERLSLVKNATTLVVATSVEASDDPIAAHCEEKQIPCFRGNLNNVADRFYQCAAYHKLDYAIRINGDNLFTDHELIDDLIEIALSKEYNFVSNVRGRTYPTGMSVEIVKTDFYRSHLTAFTSKDYKEHVTLFFYENPNKISKVYHHTNEQIVAAKGMKLAVDSEEDFTFAKHIITSMSQPHTSYNLDDLIKLIESLT